VAPTELTQPGRKTPGYYSNRRPDLVAMLPRPLGRVLDVGCGSGEVGRQLREEGASELIGIELDPAAADDARKAYETVVTGSVEQALAEIEGPFDTIVAYDVLEHLVDPWSVLGELRGLAAPGGRLQVSVPNARHLSLVWDLVLKGTFGYTETGGHRDDTHLRWFTRRDIVAAIEGSGWQVQSTAHSPLSAPRRLLERLTFGRSSEFLVLQWYVLATRE
jgi:2-polyprenyl-3-methyl-5-hydroxy-6-metoxy-1,4-benzoquinol methylase